MIKKYLFAAALLVPTTGAMAQNTGTITFINNSSTQLAFSPSQSGNPTTGCINGGGQGGNFTVAAGSSNVGIYSATCTLGQAGAYSYLTTLSQVGAGLTYPFTCTFSTSCALGPITSAPAAVLNKAPKRSKK